MADIGEYPVSDPSTTVTLNAYCLALLRVQAPADGTLDTINLYLGSGNTNDKQFTLAIWNDSGGAPGSLLTAGAGGTTGNPFAAGWFQQSISGSITSGNYYWLGVHTSYQMVFGTTSGSQTIYYKAATYSHGTAPDPFPSSPSSTSITTVAIYATYTGTGATITLTSPTANTTLQRDASSQATINIAGTYTGEPTAIEASWNGGDYVTIDDSPSGESFSGSLPNQTKGQGTLTVRFTNDTDINDSAANIGIGDRFIIIGDSIAEGRGTSAQSHGHATLVPYTFRQDDALAEANDPVDTGTNLGSHWPLLIRHIMDDQECPVEIVTCAKGSTDVAGTNHTWAKAGTEYNEMVSQASAAGGTFLAILGHLGPNAVESNVAQNTYNAAVDQFVSDAQADVQSGIKLFLSIFGEVTTVTGTRDTLRAAILEAVSDNASIGYGPCLIEDDYSDNVHPKSNAELQKVADRWWAALHDQLYGGSGGRGPRLLSASWRNDTVTLRFNQSLTGTSYTTTAFAVTDNSGARTISSATRNGSSVVLVVSGGNLSSPVTVSFGSESTSVGATVPFGAAYTLPDSSTINLPAEPFYGATASEAGSGTSHSGMSGMSGMSGGGTL